MRGLCKRAALALAIWAAVAAPAMAQTTLRMVSHADIKILDPIWTTALISRNFGYMIYDTLFSTDADLKVQPQMAEKYTVSPDKMTWTITLRDGLLWSDGTHGLQRRYRSGFCARRVASRLRRHASLRFAVR